MPFEFGTMLSRATPGTVIGGSYILAFNVPPIELTGTGVILVISFIFRNMPVGVRALALEPQVLLFDEPLSNLDAKLRRQVREEIRERDTAETRPDSSLLLHMIRKKRWQYLIVYRAFA